MPRKRSPYFSPEVGISWIAEGAGDYRVYICVATVKHGGKEIGYGESTVKDRYDGNASVRAAREAISVAIEDASQFIREVSGNSGDILASIEKLGCSFKGS